MPGAKRVNEMYGLVVSILRKVMFEELKYRGKKKLKKEIKKNFNTAYKIAQRLYYTVGT